MIQYADLQELPREMGRGTETAKVACTQVKNMRITADAAISNLEAAANPELGSFVRAGFMAQADSQMESLIRWLFSTREMLRKLEWDKQIDDE